MQGDEQRKRSWYSSPCANPACRRHLDSSVQQREIHDDPAELLGNLNHGWPALSLRHERAAEQCLEGFWPAVCNCKTGPILTYTVGNISWIHVSMWDLCRSYLPHHRPECENVHHLVVTPLGRKLWGHVACCACPLHRSYAKLRA